MISLYIVNPANTKIINKSSTITTVRFLYKLDFILDQVKRYYQKVFWSPSSGLSFEDISVLSSCEKARKLDDDHILINPGDRIIIPLGLNTFILHDVRVYE